MKWDLVPRNGRKQGNFCGSSCKRECKEISKEDSTTIFNQYWKSGSKECQITFIRSMVDEVEVKRKSESNKRKISREYKLQVNGNVNKVCQKTFIATLGIFEKFLRNSLAVGRPEGVGISPIVEKSRNPTPSAGFHWTLEDKDFLKKFFDHVPKVSSHYCRRDTEKIYLDVLINMKTKLYELYKNRCSIKSLFSIFLFNNYFKETNYSLFKPHKDQCNTCIGKDSGNVSEEDCNKHYELKCAALNQKENDKILWCIVAMPMLC